MNDNNNTNNDDNTMDDNPVAKQKDWFFLLDPGPGMAQQVLAIQVERLAPEKGCAHIAGSGTTTRLDNNTSFYN
jgi:hypothetical protein